MFDASTFIKADACQCADTQHKSETKPRKPKHSNVLSMISISLTQIILITADVLLVLPIQSQTYLGNSVLLKTFMIWLLSSCSLFRSFAFASRLSSAPALSWPSRSRLSSDSTLRTNTGTSTSRDKGREHTHPTIVDWTLQVCCPWSGSVVYILS